jgi:multidrug efflux pump subunit AcrA (membrane-fusion protein)
MLRGFGLSPALLVGLLSTCSFLPVTLADLPTHTVAPVPFRLEAKLDGVFESPSLTEVRIDAKRWGQFTVENAIPHGTRVNKGDVLVRLETAKLDEQIRDLEIGGRIAALAHGLLEREVALLEKATPLQLELARRARRIAAEDLARYESKESQLAQAENDVMLKMSQFRRENAEEELDQLEKMYTQDDLTEETEEIVLKRARFEAELARFFGELMEDRHERVAAFELPRRLDVVQKGNLLAALDLERAEAALPIALDKLKLDLERSTNERRKAAEQLAEYRADRAALPLVAPTDGILYYGRWQQGKWVESDQVAGRLRPGGKLEPQAVLFTIVGAGRPYVRAVLPEKELFKVAADATARIMPKAFADVRLPGRVRSVSAVPVAARRFEAVIDLAEDHPRLVAGMEAEIRVIAAHEPALLAIPKKAVFTEDLDDEKKFVYVVAAAGKEPQKRTVATGRANDELVEITAGLAAGEQIFLEKPKPVTTKPAEPTAAKPAEKKPEPAEKKPEPAERKPEPAEKPTDTDRS